MKIKKFVKSLFICLLVFALFAHHSFVLRAVQAKPLYLSVDYKQGKLSKEKFENELKNISYFSTFFDLEMITRSWG